MNRYDKRYLRDQDSDSDGPLYNDTKKSPNKQKIEFNYSHIGAFGAMPNDTRNSAGKINYLDSSKVSSHIPSSRGQGGKRVVN